jgi:hypothetical protein
VLEPIAMLRALLALVVLGGVARADVSLAELDALDKHESWYELLVDATYVPPAQRTDRWSHLVERAALGLIASHARDADDAWTFGDAVVRWYPQLENSKQVMAARSQAAIHGLEVCLKRADITRCVDRAVSSADVDPSEVDTTFLFAAMIARRSSLASLRLWWRGLVVRHTAKDCSDKLLGIAVADALRLAPEDARVADAQAIAFEHCWDELEEAIIHDFITSSSSSYRKNTCSYLLAKKIAAPRQCE